MRRLAYSAGAVVIILLLLVGVALSRIDADVLSRVGTDQLSRSLGYPVQVGAVSARIWPSPSVLAQDLRVGGDEQSKPFLTASAVRFELGLLAVLSGNAVIEAATLESPTLTLESGPTGPRLPARTTQREAGATLELIRIRGGTLVMGSWKLEDVVADGKLADTTAELEFTGRIDGVGPIGSGRVEVAELDSSAPKWQVNAEVATLDVEQLAKRAGITAFTRGGGTATLRAEGKGETCDIATAKLALSPIDLRSDSFGMRGAASVELARSGSYRMQLSDADVKLGTLFEKPIGVVMEVAGVLPSSDATTLPGVDVKIGERQLSGDLRFVSDVPVLTLSGDIDVALLSLEMWDLLPKRPTGVLSIQQLTYAPGAPLVASALARQLEVDLGDGKTLGIDGDLLIEGSSIRSQGLGLSYLGQQLVVAGSYDTASKSGNLELQSQGADLSVLTAALAQGEPQAFGRLYLRATVGGTHVVETLKGNGSFELPGGAFKNLSFREIIEQGETAIFEADMPPPADKPFESVNGQFEVSDGRILFSAVSLEQSGVLVLLKGSISLIDGQVNLGGRAIRAGDAEQPVQITGSIWAPFVSLGEWLDPSSPEGQEDVKTQLTMLKAMLDTMEKRGVKDPAMRGEFDRMRAEINKQLRARRTELTAPFEPPPTEDQNAPAPASDESVEEESAQ